jgi:spore germination cell wall hydrolase CwlJ-like protein
MEQAKAMNRNEWLFEIRKCSNVMRAVKLLGVLVLASCAVTKSDTPTDSPGSALNKKLRDSICSADAEPWNCMLAQNDRGDEPRVSAAPSAATYAIPKPGSVPRNGEITDPLTCLALNVYWEARNQPFAGQLAVAQVTMNRVRDARYGDNICDVVYEHKQFSWFWDGKPDTPREQRAWEKAYLVASAAMDGSGHVELQGVTHYHAVYTKPYWKGYMVQVAMIGDHVFYMD